MILENFYINETKLTNVKLLLLPTAGVARLNLSFVVWGIKLALFIPNFKVTAA